MNISEIQNIDSSFKVIKDSAAFFQGITDSSAKAADHIFYVKNKNFLNEIINTDEIKNLFIIIDEKFYSNLKEEAGKLLNAKALATVSDVTLNMCHLSKVFYHKKFNPTDDLLDGRQRGDVEIDPTAFIAQGVFIGSRVKIGANVKIQSGTVIHSDVSIGDNTQIYSNVSLYSGTIVGKNARIHAGTVIGADGFGYHFSRGVHHKIWHMGGVHIHDDVEIGANSCVDSGTFSPTIIGRGSKIDNFVQVGHNCKLGTGVILCGHVGLGGSTTIGDFTVFGGQSGAANGVKIGGQVQVAGRAGVISNLEDKETVGGFPARDMKEWLRGLATLKKLSQKNTEK